VDGADQAMDHQALACGLQVRSVPRKVLGHSTVGGRSNVSEGKWVDNEGTIRGHVGAGHLSCLHAPRSPMPLLRIWEWCLAGPGSTHICFLEQLFLLASREGGLTPVWHRAGVMTLGFLP
jgi:hypothetical protein